MVVRAVEQLLDHRLRCSGGTGHARVAAIQIHAWAEEVDGDVLPHMGDGVVVLVDVDTAGAGGKAPIAELLEQDQEPALSHEGGVSARSAAGFAVLGLPPGLPNPCQIGPGPVGGVTDRKST